MLTCNEFFKQSNRHSSLHISLLKELKSIRILHDYKHCTPDGVGQRASVQKVSDIGQDVCATHHIAEKTHIRCWNATMLEVGMDGFVVRTCHSEESFCSQAQRTIKK